MMAGQFREYSWKDIEQLIFADAGLTDAKDQRTRGELWCLGSFCPPEHPADNVVRVNVYDKPFGERMKDIEGGA